MRRIFCAFGLVGSFGRLGRKIEQKEEKWKVNENYDNTVRKKGEGKNGWEESKKWRGEIKKHEKSKKESRGPKEGRRIWNSRPQHKWLHIVQIQHRLNIMSSGLQGSWSVQFILISRRSMMKQTWPDSFLTSCDIHFLEQPET